MKGQMATYAIGDVQGCYRTLQRLLKQIGFQPSKDVLWFAGDLVNRGPRSLDVLRFVHDHSDTTVCVLGNHELLLLALYDGVLDPSLHPALHSVLHSKDIDRWIRMVSFFPLIHRQRPWVLVHAGIPPFFKLQTVIKEANALEAMLQDRLLRIQLFLECFSDSFKRPSAKFTNTQPPSKRACLLLQGLTRMRVCKSRTEMDWTFTGPPPMRPLKG